MSANWVDPRTCPFSPAEIRAALSQAFEEIDDTPVVPGAALSHFVLALLAQLGPELRKRVRDHLQAEWSVDAIVSYMEIGRASCRERV